MKEYAKLSLSERAIQEKNMRILVCDDDKAFAAQLRERLLPQITAVDRWAKVDTVSDPRELSKEVLSHYDIVFLDIDMGQVNGIDLAKKLRQTGRDTVLIFVTNLVEYSLEGYEVQAFRYLLKNELDTKLEPYVQQALSVCRKERELLRLNCDGEELDIPPKNLVYVETAARRLILHLCDMPRDILRTRTTMAELSELLAARGFLRVHKSFLVNMAYIQRLQSTSVILTTGKELPVSSRSYSEIRKTYLQWKGQKRWTLG